MPVKKKKTLTDAERAKRIRETAREAEADNDPKSFERAFEKVARQRRVSAKPDAKEVSPKRPSKATYTAHGLMAIGLVERGYGREYMHFGQKLTDLSRWVSDADEHAVFSEIGRIAEKFGINLAQTFAREIDDGIAGGTISNVKDAERRLRKIRNILEKDALSHPSRKSR